jgi:CcmD family protein
MFYLAIAMIIVWVAITLYLLYMSQRQRQLDEELRTLEELLHDRRKE